jgi:hypothetical protein
VQTVTCALAYRVCDQTHYVECEVQVFTPKREVRDFWAQARRGAATAGLFLAAAAQAQAFTIYNNGAHTIQNIYESLPSDTQWGPDRLAGYLNPDQSWTSPLRDNCVYDILIVYENGQQDEEDNWNTCTTNMTLSY